MLGDKVVVLIDMGAGKVREETIEARSAGGSVKPNIGLTFAVVSELTRNGREVRSVTVPVDRLLAAIEVPRGR